MAAPLRTTRQDWLDAGLRALGAGGVEAVRIESVAAELGVTKGGFYGQFRDRPAFLAALLEEWERRAVHTVVEESSARGDEDPRTAIRRAGAATFSADLLPVDLAVRSWARVDPTAEERVRRVDDLRMQHLRRLFGELVEDPAEVEARSLLAFSLTLGQHFLRAGHLGWTRAEAIELAAGFLLSDR